MLFKRKKKEAAGGFGDIWLISYADMITTMLVVFVALTSLSMKDQTGALLTDALGHFVDAQDAFGGPSDFPPSGRAMQLTTMNPAYPVADVKPGEKKGSYSPQQEGPTRVLDGEEQRMTQFLDEMKRRMRYEKLTPDVARAALDFYQPVRKHAPYLESTHMDALQQIVPLLHHKEYRVYVVRWATSPKEKAWERAAEQSRLYADEIAEVFQLDEEVRSRLIPVGRPWWYPGFPRPELSFVVTKTAAAR